MARLIITSVNVTSYEGGELQVEYDVDCDECSSRIREDELEDVTLPSSTALNAVYSTVRGVLSATLDLGYYVEDALGENDEFNSDWSIPHGEYAILCDECIAEVERMLTEPNAGVELDILPVDLF